jgi:hypothetical protein
MISFMGDGFAMSMSRRSNTIPFVVAFAIALVPCPALARGGGHGGGGHGGGGHFGGGHFGGGGGHYASGAYHGGAFHGGGFRGGGYYRGGYYYGVGGHFGTRYGSHLYLGPRRVVWGSPHWGRGFWLWGGTGWAWYTGPWWSSPAYPGWVWMGPQWVWDGAQWIWQDGYWTNADMPQEPASGAPGE